MKVHELFEVKERSVRSIMHKPKEHIDGNFSCSSNRITSLDGSPSSVSNMFSCFNNKLTSLVGGPTTVGSSFYCSKNLLTSLKGAPSSVGGEFYCADNKLTSLDGAPSSIGGEFVCHTNKLTSLHNIHKQIKKIGDSANFTNNPIVSHVLGLLLIEELPYVVFDNEKLEQIINKHLQGERDIFACQEELIEAGYEELAQL